MRDDSGRDLHLPTTGAATAAAVVLHPHPAMGGDRHHPLVVAAAEGLAAAGMAALRLDLPDPDVSASAARLEAAAADLAAEVPTTRILLVGYSWGAAVVARAAPEGLVARVLVAPPVALLDPGMALAAPGAALPTLVLVPAHDQYGPPEEIRAALGDAPGATIEVVEGTDHFLAGAVARIAARTVTWLQDRS